MVKTRDSTARFIILPQSVVSLSKNKMCKEKKKTSYLHEYCTCMQTQMDTQAFNFCSKGNGHNTLHRGTFACFSTRVKAVCLQICQSVICVLRTLSRLCRHWRTDSKTSNLPGQLKIPWYNEEENGIEELSPCWCRQSHSLKVNNVN